MANGNVAEELLAATKLEVDPLWSSMKQVRVDFVWIRRFLFANIAISLVTLIVIIAKWKDQIPQ